MSTEDAKSYLSKREIPRLFESLMTGLMYHRPQDHIRYLIDCLEKVKDKGYQNVTWSSFVDIRRAKTPLPPIDQNGQKRPGSRTRSRPSSRAKTPVKIEEKESLETRKGSPLPPISKSPPPAKAILPNVPITLIMGGPGSGKLTQAQKLLEKNPGWVHLSMGDLLKTEVAKKGSVGAKWGMIGDLVSQGEMAPEEVTAELMLTHVKKHPDAKGFIIEGYPRTSTQLEEFEKEIGRLDLAILIDCEEYYCTQRLLKRGKEKGKIDDNLAAISNRISFFKENTLPVCKYFDDLGKLVVVDGDRDIQDIAFNMGQIFKAAIKRNFKTPEPKVKPVRPKAQPKPQTPPKTSDPKAPKRTGDSFVMDLDTRRRKKKGEILLYTHNAVNLYYYKYTVDGMNIIFVNLLFFVILSLILGYSDHENEHYSGVTKVILGILAIVPLTYYIGMAIICISAQSSYAVGAVLNATCGTVVEMILSVVVLNKGNQSGSACYVELVKSNLAGTIIGSILLIPVCLPPLCSPGCLVTWSVRSVRTSSPTQPPP